MKGNTASMIALIVATLVLLVVGGNSYRNYLRAQYEREYGVLEKHRKAADTHASAASTMPVGPGGVTSTLDPAPTITSQSPQSTFNQVGGQPAAGVASVTTPQGQGAVATIPSTGGQTQAGNVTSTTPIPATLPPSPPPVGAGAGTTATTSSVDPEIARLQARLKALEQESALYQQKLNQGEGGKAAASSGLVAKPVESGSLREVMEGKGKGATPALFPEQAKDAPAVQNAAKAEYEKQIREAPAAARVLAFNAEWGFVQIDAGKNRNISTGTKFAVRRGVSIVGYVKVTEVSDNMSIAELTSRNEFSETARKPKPGDDVISWPLF